MENLPAMHAVHVESAVALPTPYPFPVGHVRYVHAMHAPFFNQVLVAHAPAHAASVPAVPGTSGAPAGQVGLEWDPHAVLSDALEYVVPVQSEQLASTDALPTL